MKTTILSILIFLAGISISCTSDNSASETIFKSTAKILGRDISLCPCCGDWLIKIDNDQNRYEFQSLPQNSTIDLQNAQFPISIKLNWRFDENSFCSDHIIIEQIELN